jgi:antitoxin Phd
VRLVILTNLAKLAILKAGGLTMKTSATEIKNHFGEYLDEAKLEPVMIEKMGRPVAVMISNKEYERLLAIEDAYWAHRAIAAEKEGFIGAKASMKLLKSR